MLTGVVNFSTGEGTPVSFAAIHMLVSVKTLSTSFMDTTVDDVEHSAHGSDVFGLVDHISLSWFRFIGIGIEIMTTIDKSTTSTVNSEKTKLKKLGPRQPACGQSLCVFFLLRFFWSLLLQVKMKT